MFDELGKNDHICDSIPLLYWQKPAVSVAFIPLLVGCIVVMVISYASPTHVLLTGGGPKLHLVLYACSWLSLNATTIASLSVFF
jgi:hypothetical protein